MGTQGWRETIFGISILTTVLLWGGARSHHLLVLLVCESQMYHQYFCSSAWVVSAYGLGGLILTLWIVNAYLNVQLNAWTARFYDLMQNATKMEPGVVTFDDAQPLFVEWAVMSGINVCSKPIINWLTRHWAFYWREALTADLLFRWRSKAGGESARRIEGASQRVQDDCYQLSRFLCDLGQGILAAFLELITFCPVLWSLSSGIEGLPNGLLMWAALGGFVLGYAVSILVGWRLVSLEYNNQAAEAAFRKELVYAEDEVQGHGELSVCHGLFRALRRVYYTLFAHLLYFETWSALFLKAMSLIPLVVLAPHVYNRSITLGTYMQAVGAFNSVTEGMSQPLSRWVDFNIMLSVVRRLREFESALPPREVLKTYDESSRLIGSGPEPELHGMRTIEE